MFKEQLAIKTITNTLKVFEVMQLKLENAINILNEIKKDNERKIIEIEVNNRNIEDNITKAKNFKDNLNKMMN